MRKDITEEGKLHELRALCKAIQAKSKRPKYSPAIKRQIQDVVKSGVPINSVSKVTGVAGSAIRKWVKGRYTSPTPPTPVQVLPIVESTSSPTVKSDRVLLSLKTGEFEVTVYTTAGR